MTREITSDELKSMLESGRPVSVIDVREAPAYDAWHIAGSVSVPVIQQLRMGDATALLDATSDLPNDRPVVTVCNVGQSSLIAANALSMQGRDAASLAGGMRSWSAVWTTADINTADQDITLTQIRRNGKGCLSYLLGSLGTAAVIDPSVNCEVYETIAARAGLTIAEVWETHVHADHVSRARELAERTGATLRILENTRVQFPYEPLTHGQQLSLGAATISVIATPGHTNDSVCYFINDSILLTGDTLFVESIGRPDLEKGDAGAADNARALYHTLHERLLTLPDHVAVYPCHTTPDIGFDGTPIGADMGTLRRELELLNLEEDAFVDEIVDRIGEKPPSYQAVIQINEGRLDLGEHDPLDLEAGPNRCAVG